MDLQFFKCYENDCSQMVTCIFSISVRQAINWMQWGGCGLEDWESMEKYDIVKKTWATSWFNEDWDWILEEIFKMQVPRTYIQQSSWFSRVGGAPENLHIKRCTNDCCSLLRIMASCWTLRTVAIRASCSNQMKRRNHLCSQGQAVLTGKCNHTLTLLPYCWNMTEYTDGNHTAMPLSPEGSESNSLHGWNVSLNQETKILTKEKTMRALQEVSKLHRHF